MRQTDCSILINRPAAETFQYATDPSHLAGWFGSASQEVTVFDDLFAAGSSFSIGTRGGDRARQEFIYQVIDHDPPRTFTVRTAGRLLTYTSRLAFHEENGQTKLTDTLEMENPPGLLNLLGGWLLGRVRRAHQERLARLREKLDPRSS